MVSRISSIFIIVGTVIASFISFSVASAATEEDSLKYWYYYNVDPDRTLPPVTDLKLQRERFHDYTIEWTQPMPNLAYVFRYYTGEQLSQEQVQEHLTQGKNTANCPITDSFSLQYCLGAIIRSNQENTKALAYILNDHHIFDLYDTPIKEEGGTLWVEYKEGDLFSKISNVVYISPSTPVQKDLYFDDLNGIKYYPEINYLFEKGIVKGRTDRNFAPQHILPRAEALALMVRTFFPNVHPEEEVANFKIQHPNYTYAYFPDVLLNEWFSGYILYAKDHGLIAGRSNISFAPRDPITLQEYDKLLINFMPIAFDTLLFGDDTTGVEGLYNTYSLLLFSAVDLHPDFQNAINLVNIFFQDIDVDNNEYDQPIRRAKAAAILANYLKNQEK